MTIEYNNLLRNRYRSAFVDSFGGGTMELLDSSENVLLAISDIAFDTPSDGVAEKSGTWQGIVTAAAGSGTEPASYRFVGSSGEIYSDDSLGAGGSGANLEITNNIDGVDDMTLVEGNIATVTAYTYTVPSSA